VKGRASVSAWRFADSLGDINLAKAESPYKGPGITLIPVFHCYRPTAHLLAPSGD